MADPERVIGGRVGDHEFAFFVAPGSVQERCDACYAPVWVAPSIMATVLKAVRRPEILCVPCWFRCGGWEQDKLCLAPGQLQEISKYRPDLAMRIARAFQQPGAN